MDSNWADYWAEARQMGQPVFLLKRGTMLGLIIFGFLEVAPRVFAMVDDNNLPIGSFIVSAVLGGTIAKLLWWANERSYQKVLAGRDSDPAEATVDAASGVGSKSAKHGQNDD